MTITIRHTHADGTLVEGTSKGDGTNTILKGNGFAGFAPWLCGASPAAATASPTTTRSTVPPKPCARPATP